MPAGLASTLCTSGGSSRAVLVPTPPTALLPEREVLQPLFLLAFRLQGSFYEHIAFTFKPLWPADFSDEARFCLRGSLFSPLNYRCQVSAILEPGLQSLLAGLRSQDHVAAQKLNALYMPILMHCQPFLSFAQGVEYGEILG